MAKTIFEDINDQRWNDILIIKLLEIPGVTSVSTETRVEHVGAGQYTIAFPTFRHLIVEYQPPAHPGQISAVVEPYRNCPEVLIEPQV